MEFKNKYLKYKTKYLELKAELLHGGAGEDDDKIKINLNIIENSPLYTSIISFLKDYNENLSQEIAGGAKPKGKKTTKMTLEEFQNQPAQQDTHVQDKSIEQIFMSIMATEFEKEKKNLSSQISDEEELNSYLTEKYDNIFYKIKDNITQENINIDTLSDDDISYIFYLSKEIIEIIEIQDDILAYVNKIIKEYEEEELRKYTSVNAQKIYTKYDDIYKNIFEYIRNINNITELKKLTKTNINDIIFEQIKNYNNPESQKYHEDVVDEDVEDYDLVQIQIKEKEEKKREERKRKEALAKEEADRLEVERKRQEALAKEEADRLEEEKLRREQEEEKLRREQAEAEAERVRKEALKKQQEERLRQEQAEEAERVRQEALTKQQEERLRQEQAEDFHLINWGQEGREAEEKYLPIFKSRNFKICILEIKYNKTIKTDEFNKKLNNLQNKLKCLNYHFKKNIKNISNIVVKLQSRFEISDDFNIIQKFTFDDFFMQYISQIKDALCQYLFEKNTDSYTISEKYSFSKKDGIYSYKNNEFDLIYNIKLTNLINVTNKEKFKTLSDNIEKLKKDPTNKEIKTQIILNLEKKYELPNLKKMGLVKNFILSK